MSEHAPFPPSSLEHWNNCPGFIQAENESEYFSDKGTKLHKAWETGNLEGLDETEMAAVTFVRQCEIGPVEGVVMREVKLNCAGIAWGTIDYLKIILLAKRARIIDAKFGRISVQPAQTNIQLWAYSLGVWHTYPEVNEIKVTIAVPYRSEITHATFKRDTHYHSFKAYISRIIERVELFRQTGDVTLLNYHPKSCAFCARYNCPIKRQRLIEAMGANPIPPIYNVPQDLTPEQISQAKILSNQFKRWAAEVDKRAMELSDAGQEIPGFERKFLAGRRRNPSGPDIETLWKLTSPNVSMGFSKFVELTAEINLVKTIEQIRDAAPRGQKKGREEQFLDQLRDADIGQPSGGSYYLKPKPEIYDENKD